MSAIYGGGGGGGSVSLTSGEITSGYLGNASVVSGSIASGQIGLNALASGVNAYLAGKPVNTPLVANQSLLYTGSNWESWVPPGAIYGLTLGNPGASTNQYTVTNGQCADSSNEVMIDFITNPPQPLAVAGTVATTTSGTNGNDSFTIPTTSGYANISNGTKLVSFNQNIVPYLNPVTIGWQVSQSGTAIVSPLTLYGLASVGDLIGSNISGFYSRITAIQSGGTYLTTSISGSITSGTIGQQIYVIQNPTMAFGSGAVTCLDYLHSTTSGAVLDNQTITASGQAITVGGLYSGGVRPVFMYPYVGIVNGNANMWCSTQLTKPYAYVNGLNSEPCTYYRRIGSFCVQNGSIVPFNQMGNSNHRTYTFNISEIGNASYALSGGTQTSWTYFSTANQLCPPTANIVTGTGTVNNAAGGNVWFQCGTDSTANSDSNLQIGASIAGNFHSYVEVPCDGGQGMQYLVNGGATGYLYVYGYKEDV